MSDNDNDKPAGGRPASIIVMNFSGNVGKTTVVTNILSPRMPAAVILSVESLNEGIADGEGGEGGGGKERITAKNARISDCNISAGDDAIAASRIPLTRRSSVRPKRSLPVETTALPASRPPKITPERGDFTNAWAIMFLWKIADAGST